MAIKEIAGATPPTVPTTFRHRLSTLFDDDLPPNLAAQIFNVALAALIIVNVGSVILELTDYFGTRYEWFFEAVERASTIFFAAEYIARLWASVDQSSGRYRDPFWGRLRYATRFFSLIDLLSVLPAVLGTLGAADFRTLRLLRLLRMLKLTRHSTAFSLLWAVVREEAATLGAVLFIILLTLIMSSSLMYLFEEPAQPKIFSSIPAAMWWAIVTLTTVGYGDMVPTTIPGRLLGGFVAVIGVGTMALFSGILTASFLDQLRLRRERYREIVAADTATHRLNAQEIRAIKRVGEQLGLPDGDIEEILHELVATNGLRVTCPHCGEKLR